MSQLLLSRVLDGAFLVVRQLCKPLVVFKLILSVDKMFL